jgi:Domain of unknown function (DUF4281)
MSLESVFSFAGAIAIAGWLVLVLMPYRSKVPRAVAGIVAVLLSMGYVALLGTFRVGHDGGFGSLAEVSRLFQSPGLLLAGWIHYLAFDLLIGTWERGEAERIGLSRWALAPCLLLTFLFGPLGWLGFMAVRHGRRLSTAHVLPAA